MSRAKKLSLLVLVFLAICGFGVSLALVVTRYDPYSNFYTALLVTLFAFCLLLVMVKTFLDAAVEAYSMNTKQKRSERLARGLCPKCGYDIRGNDDRCSECGEPLPPTGERIPVKIVEAVETPAVNRIIEAARAEGLRAGADHFGSQHVLLALFSEEDSVAVTALRALGIERREVQQEMDRLLSDGQLKSEEVEKIPANKPL